MQYDLRLPSGDVLTAINVYGKFDDDGYCSTTMHHMISDVTPFIHQHKNKKGRHILLAGDLNVSEQWDVKHSNRDPSHKLVHDRLTDRAMGLKSCTWEKFGSHVQTHAHSFSDFTWQDDYMYVNGNLLEKMKECIVHDDMKEFSDHFPVKITADI